MEYLSIGEFMNYQSKLKVLTGPCQVSYFIHCQLPPLQSGSSLSRHTMSGLNAQPSIAHCLIYITLTFILYPLTLNYETPINPCRSDNDCALLLALGSCRNEKIITFRSLLKEMASAGANNTLSGSVL